jgi:hypothetical protein
MASKKNKRPTQVTKPLLEFKMKDNRVIRLWVYDAGQTVHFDAFRRNGMTFGGAKTAGLIYETIDEAGHHAVEYHIENSSTWEWIHKWMTKGLVADGHMVLPEGTCPECHGNPFHRDECSKRIS